MPQGRVHTLINTGVFTAGTLLALPLLPPADRAPLPPLLIGALIGTVLITPDLDMRGVRVNAQRAWGPLGFIWQPLIDVSRHRGVSHTYLRGPAVRAAYLLLMLAVLLFTADLAVCTLSGASLHAVLQQQARAARSLTHLHHRTMPPGLLCAWIYGGYWAAQVLHLMADRVPLRLGTL